VAAPRVVPDDVPHGLGLGAGASWWPVVPLTVAGLVVGLAVCYLPGHPAQIR
jgi:hypothetical protein